MEKVQKGAGQVELKEKFPLDTVDRLVYLKKEKITVC
ncbi:hypothetical protein ALO_20977 [Acetonema longum DSM 6540]|uniref:Uncharacterized protein n=1 Tax=Acetonema longum DSM 6540 TaxID=1009370 RepID=F7NPZ8_9FIRM|nr:hypothetical protein ALO_20977 [Acetonema longum DSM 6540]